MSDFRYVLHDLMPELKVYFISEELGCGVYATNDVDSKHYTDRYYVEVCIDDNSAGSEYFDTLEKALAYAAEVLGRESVTIEECSEWTAKQAYTEDYLYVHEFQVVDF